jgi:hypothetical protein
MIHLGSDFDIIPAIAPGDFATPPASVYISLKNIGGVYVVFFKGVGTAGEDPALELQQAKDVSGTAAKDLNGFVDVYKKQHLTAVNTVAGWTKVSQTADEDYVGDGTSAESQGLYAAYVPAGALDTLNGFDCLKANIKDTATAAQIGCLFYLVGGLRYAAAPNRLPSPFANMAEV